MANMEALLQSCGYLRGANLVIYGILW